MKIGIIGAGFVGLAAAYQLTNAGHTVTVIEKEDRPGGLAIGFKEKKWTWTLERHYHHLFVSDYEIRNLAKEVGCKIDFKRPKTSILISNKIYQLDSPVNMLKLPYLSIIDKIRMGLVLGYLKITPFWLQLENITAISFLKKYMGKRVTDLLWSPLFDAKFGKYASGIPASWFWARIKKRSAFLGYPVGSFEKLALSVEQKAKRKGAKFLFGEVILKIRQSGGIEVVLSSGKTTNFDKVISTLPGPVFTKVVEGLPVSYKKSLNSLEGLGAVNLILILKKTFLEDGTYWLNINQKGFPFLAVVEHTNMVDKKFYNGDVILYIGNYLSSNHKYFNATAAQLVKDFVPFLKKINPRFSEDWVKKALIFKAPFAQPIIPLNYSKLIPPFKTPINNLYLANMQQVYPWDRGTNYAVKLGEKLSRIVRRY